MNMKKKLVYEVVYDEIKHRIETGEWQPGQRIPTIEEISAELMVGISSVREAVRILSKQKVLIVEQGRGTFVNQLIANDINLSLNILETSSWLQLTETRLVIEPELAALAAEKSTEKDAAAIQKSANTMANKVNKGMDFLKEDIEFHHQIALASKNEILLNMIRMIGAELLDSRRQTMRMPGMDIKAASYHQLIADAIAQRNPQQARELMRLHIIDMKNEYKSGVK